MKRQRILTLSTVLLLLSVAGLRSQDFKPMQIKIGSLAPARSPWDVVLNEIADEWARITGGRVRLKIYAGGIAGSEHDMVRKLRTGTLDGAGLTNMGMVKVNPNLFVLNTPFLMDTKEEFDYVLDIMRPAFVQPIEESGLKVLVGDLAGWVYFFTKSKIAYPEDLRKFKISFTPGEPELEEALKKMGYRVIPNEPKDVMMALQSGMVDAISYPPLLAASAQYFALAPHMMSLPMSILMGWLVLNEKTWQAIPAEYREALQKAVNEKAHGLYEKAAKLESEAIDIMKKNGLVVDQAPADALNRWRAAAQEAMDEVVGKTYRQAIRDQALALLREFRQKNAR